MIIIRGITFKRRVIILNYEYTSSVRPEWSCNENL